MAWQRKDWDTVGKLFHPDAVLLPPDMGAMIRSRASIVATYQDFMAQAQLHSVAMTRCEVQAFAQSCMVHCAFQIEFTIASQRERSELEEIYWLEPGEAAAMQIVGRQQLLSG